MKQNNTLPILEEGVLQAHSLNRNLLKSRIRIKPPIKSWKVVILEFVYLKNNVSSLFNWEDISFALFFFKEPFWNVFNSSVR